ncbi:MAG: GNAT family N-acetyltransferase [Actinomycetota bacterium]|nr:GNAT family N-acetyltransferase [Actinomycetota bacterium]
MSVTVTFRDVDLGDKASHGRLFELLGALRPHLTRAESDRFLEEGNRQGLRCVVAEDRQGELAGAALYRILATSRGRIVFLDDLVSSPDVRSRGVGAAVLEEVEARGRRAGCARIELDSGRSNGGAHRFYERHGLAVIALHFAKDLG